MNIIHRTLSPVGFLHCVWLWLDRSTNAGAVIARQVGYGLLSGRTDPLTTFLAALMQISLHRWVIARFSNVACQFSVSTWHTSGSISASGYVLEKVQDGLALIAQKSPSLLIRVQPYSHKKSSKTSYKVHKISKFRQYFSKPVTDSLLT